MFLAEQREGYRESHPEVVGRKVSSLLGKMWTGLQADVKKRYLDMEKKDKERYIKEIKEYQESSSCQAFLKKQTENAVRNFCGNSLVCTLVVVIIVFNSCFAFPIFIVLCHNHCHS